MTKKIGSFTKNGVTYTGDDNLLHQFYEFSSTLDPDVRHQFGFIIKELEDGRNLEYKNGVLYSENGITFDANKYKNKRIDKKIAHGIGKEKDARLAIDSLNNFTPHVSEKSTKYDWSSEKQIEYQVDEKGDYVLNNGNRIFVSSPDSLDALRRLESLQEIQNYRDQDQFVGYNDHDKQYYINLINHLNKVENTESENTESEKTGIEQLIENIKNGNLSYEEIEILNDIGILTEHKKTNKEQTKENEIKTTTNIEDTNRQHQSRYMKGSSSFYTYDENNQRYVLNDNFWSELSQLGPNLFLNEDFFRTHPQYSMILNDHPKGLFVLNGLAYDADWAKNNLPLVQNWIAENKTTNGESSLIYSNWVPIGTDLYFYKNSSKPYYKKYGNNFVISDDIEKDEWGRTILSKGVFYNEDRLPLPKKQIMYNENDLRTYIKLGNYAFWDVTDKHKPIMIKKFDDDEWYATKKNETTKEWEPVHKLNDFETIVVSQFKNDKFKSGGKIKKCQKGDKLNNPDYGTKPSKFAEYLKSLNWEDMLLGTADFVATSTGINKNKNLEKEGIAASMLGAQKATPTELYPIYTDKLINYQYDQEIDKLRNSPLLVSDAKLNYIYQLEKEKAITNLEKEKHVQKSKDVNEYNQQLLATKQKYNIIRNDVANENKKNWATGLTALKAADQKAVLQNTQSIKNLIYQMRHNIAQDKQERAAIEEKINQTNADINFKNHLAKKFNELGGYNIIEDESVRNEYIKSGNWIGAMQTYKPETYTDIYNEYMGNYLIDTYNNARSHFWFGRPRINSNIERQNTNVQDNIVETIIRKRGGKLTVNEKLWLDQNKANGNIVYKLHKDIYKLLLKMLK